MYCILIIIKTQLYILYYIFDIYVINTRLPAGPARFKNGRVATKNYALKCGRGFVYLCPRVDFIANTRSATRPSPPMNSSTMPPRRQRREERTPSTQRVEPDEDYSNIIFKNEDQRDKFQNLKERPIIPIRFICDNVLRNLGFFEYVMHLFRAIGMGLMFNMHRETYLELV